MKLLLEYWTNISPFTLVLVYYELIFSSLIRVHCLCQFCLLMLGLFVTETKNHTFWIKLPDNKPQFSL